MAHVDFKNRSITAKVVYYGCGLCGKTASLEYINSHSKNASELMAVSTEGDRTIFFDFLPIELGKIRGIDTKFKLYAVPGQVRYNMTRKLVLKDVDGVVFVVDSQPSMLRANLDSLGNLYENLAEQGVNPEQIPIVLHYNKRDLPGVMSLEELEKKFNTKHYAAFAGSALSGEGVFETLDHVCKTVFDSLASSLGVRQETKAGAAAPLDANAVAASPADAGPAPEVQASAQTGNIAAEPSSPPAEDVSAPAVAETEREPSAAASAARPAGAPGAVLDLCRQMSTLVDQFRRCVGELEGLSDDLVPPTPAQGSASLSLVMSAPQPELEREKLELQHGAEALRAELQEAKGAREQSDARAAHLEGELREAKEQIGRITAQAETARRELDELRGATGRRIADLEGELTRARADLAKAAAKSAESADAPRPLTSKPAEAAPKPASRDEHAQAAASRSAAGPAAEKLAETAAAAKPAEAVVPTPAVKAAEAPVPAPAAAAKPAEAVVPAPAAKAAEAAAPAPAAKAAEAAAPTPAVKPAEAAAPAPAANAVAAAAPAAGAAAGPVAEAAGKEEARSAVPGAESPQAGKPEEPTSATEKDPFADNKEHQNASRIARVMVADIFLYHRSLVLQGIQNGNAHEILRDQLDEARKTFQARVAERVWKQRDYLMIEFERLLKERAKDAAAVSTN